MIYYRVYGLTFRSNRELPGLERIKETSIVDYSLNFNGSSNWFEVLRREFHSPWYVSTRPLKCGRRAIEAWKTEDSRKFLFRFYDGIEFIIDRRSKEIWVDGMQRVSLQAATHHLLFSLPGFLLGLRKSTCLRGAVIGSEEGAIALVGKSNSGKSVLCAELAAREIEILTDDLVALDVIGSTVKVYPGYPWICLRIGSLHLVRTNDRFRSKWHYLDEVYATWDLRQTGDPSQFNPRELKAIYLLAPVEDSKCKPAIEQVPRHEALMKLMQAANCTHIPYPDFRPQEFSLLASVITAVPTYGLRYHLSVDSVAALSGLLVKAPGGKRPKRGAAFN